MFKIFKTLIVLLLFLTFQSSYAQRKTFKEIHLGEYVPKVILKGWLDQKQQPVMLSSLYKNKLLIIDFWATWCGSCILELPRLDSLQKLLKDSIKVVPVGYQTLKVTQDFFKKHPDKKFNDLHFLTNDSILTRRLFPHKGLPHLIWIDSTGKVVAITDGQNLTYNNIKQVLKTGSLAVRQKKDILNFNFLSPFHLRDTTYSARSIFTSHTPGIPSYEAWGTDTDKVLKDHFRNRIFLSNLPLIRMYWVAVFHHELSINNFGRMVFEVKDSLRFMQPKLAMETYRKSKYFLSINRDDWEQENTYCYELQMQEPRPDSLLFKYMVEDLNRYLNVNGRYENRMDDCFILKYNPHGANKLIPSVKPPFVKYESDWARELEGGTTAQLSDILNKYIVYGQIVDETQISNVHRFDFIFTGLKFGFTFEQMNEMLQPYGLRLERGKRNVRVFVITEN